MRTDELIKYVRQESFRPFRLFLSNGERFEIRHPEMILVTQAIVVIAIRRGDEVVPSDSVYCDPRHITHVEPRKGRAGPVARKRPPGKK